jgi:hypothetical protein
VPESLVIDNNITANEAALCWDSASNDTPTPDAAEQALTPLTPPEVNDGCPQVAARLDCDTDVIPDGDCTDPGEAALCTNNTSDDGADDAIVNDGCVRVGSFDDCDPDGDGDCTDSFALPVPTAYQSCTDGIDNDGDGNCDTGSCIPVLPADIECQAAAVGGDTDNDGWADNADVGFDPEIAQDNAIQETVRRNASLASFRYTYNRVTGIIEIGNAGGGCWILRPAGLPDGDINDLEAIAACAGAPAGYWRRVNLDGTGDGINQDANAIDPDAVADDGCSPPAPNPAVGISEAADHCYDGVDDDLGDAAETGLGRVADDGCPGGPAQVGTYSENADWCAGGGASRTDYDIYWVKLGWAGDPTGTDNCPTVWNPTQTNTDELFAATAVFPAGDALGDACDPDDDADGITDAIENYLPTDPLDRCSNGVAPNRSDTWGLDQDLNRTITVVGDVLKYSGKIGASVTASPPTSWAISRLDLDGNKTITVVGDVLKYSGKIGASCTP